MINGACYDLLIMHVSIWGTQNLVELITLCIGDARVLTRRRWGSIGLAVDDVLRASCTCSCLINGITGLGFGSGGVGPAGVAKCSTGRDPWMTCCCGVVGRAPCWGAAWWGTGWEPWTWWGWDPCGGWPWCWGVCGLDPWPCVVGVEGRDPFLPWPSIPAASARAVVWDLSSHWSQKAALPCKHSGCGTPKWSIL